MSFELKLLRRIITERDLKSVRKKKLSVDFFYDQRARELFKFINQHFVKYGETPSPDIVMHDFPSLYEDLPQSEDSISVLCDKIREKRLFNDIGIAIKEIHEKLENQGALDALSLYKNKLPTLSSLYSTDRDIDATNCIEETLSEYEILKSTSGMMGIPYPWPALNKATLGMHGGELIVIYARPKCVPIDTKVLTKDGTFVPIQEAQWVASLNHSSQKFHWAEVTDHMPVIQSEVVEVVTMSGNKVRLGIEHPVLRPNFAYTNAGQLNAGDYIGTAKRIPQYQAGENAINERKAELLGLLIGNANFTGTQLTFTSANSDTISRLRVLLLDFDCILYQAKNPIQYGIKKRKTKNSQGTRSNPLNEWIKSLGLKGHLSVDKFVPKELFQSSLESIAAFLGGLLATDGSLKADKNRVINWSTSSKTLAYQLKHLLIRMGVSASVYEVFPKYIKQDGIRANSFHINVYSAEQHEILIQKLLPYVAAKYKQEAMLTLIDYSFRKRHNDGIPFNKDLLKTILDARVSSGRFWHDVPMSGFSSDKLFRRTGNISRHLLRVLATTFDTHELDPWIHSDVFWDKIVSVRSLGIMDCVDISVEGDHNFLVSDVITHNSQKTWISLYIAMNAMKYNKRILFVSKEMTVDQLRRRLVCMFCKYDYEAYRLGKLTTREMNDFRDNLEALSENSPFIISNITSTSLEATMDFRAKIEEYNADVAIFDGVYLCAKDWADMVQITRNMKAIAQEKNIPIIINTQKNRSGSDISKKGGGTDDLSDLAYSDSFSQDADLLIRLRYSEQEKENSELFISLPGVRENRGTSFTIHARVAQDFSQKWVNESGEEGAHNDTIYD